MDRLNGAWNAVHSNSNSHSLCSRYSHNQNDGKNRNLLAIWGFAFILVAFYASLCVHTRIVSYVHCTEYWQQQKYYCTNHKTTKVSYMCHCGSMCVPFYFILFFFLFSLVFFSFSCSFRFVSFILILIFAIESLSNSALLVERQASHKWKQGMAKQSMCSKAACNNEYDNNKAHEIISFNYYDNSYCVYINTNTLGCVCVCACKMRLRSSTHRQMVHA